MRFFEFKYLARLSQFLLNQFASLIVPTNSVVERTRAGRECPQRRAVSIESEGGYRPFKVSEYVGATVDAAVVTTTLLLTVTATAGQTITLQSGTDLPANVTYNAATSANVSAIKSALSPVSS